MLNYITPYPWNRTNEVLDPRISSFVITEEIKHHLIKGSPNEDWINGRCQESFLKNFALDLVTETVYNYPHPYVSEKTLRPLASKKFFIVIGAPGILSLLHSKGFKTFNHFINEDYDSEPDPWKRWCLLEQCIKEFVLKPLDEIKELVVANQDLLDHNFETLKTLEDTEIAQCLELKP